MSDIESRFGDQVGDFKMFMLNEGESSLFQPADQLLSVPTMPVTGFSLAYPKASFEIEEASKCIALGRYTASVFHCMRALECGIKAMCALIGVPDPTKPVEKNWGFILGEIQKAIDAKWPSKTRLAGTMGAKLENLYATLDAVKNPWRNATMHVEGVYMPHEALHITRCTCMFLLELARYCDEEGREAITSPAMATVKDGPASGG